MMRKNIGMWRSGCLLAAMLAATLLPTHVSEAAERLNLAPRKTKTFIEGPDIRREYFSKGNQKYGFKVPAGLEVVGTSDQLIFSFREIPGAQIKIEKSFLSPDDPISTEGRIDLRYTSLALRKLPQGASQVEHGQVLKDPYPINGWTGISYDFTFLYGNTKTASSVAVLNFDKEDQLIISVVAPEEHFKKVQAACSRILNSIHPIDPDSEVDGESFS